MQYLQSFALFVSSVLNNGYLASIRACEHGIFQADLLVMIFDDLHSRINRTEQSQLKLSSYVKWTWLIIIY